MEETRDQGPSEFLVSRARAVASQSSDSELAEMTVALANANAYEALLASVERLLGEIEKL
jgi:hypothetical protein